MDDRELAARLERIEKIVSAILSWEGQELDVETGEIIQNESEDDEPVKLKKKIKEE